jgi:hypothetical protein
MKAAQVAPGVKVVSLRCQYCNAPAVFRKSSEHIYQGRDYGAVWQCGGSCDAYVGAHPDGSPKGILANKALRQLKMQVHAVFDPLWQNFGTAYPEMKRCSPRIRQTMRGRAYSWLAEQLGIAFDDCHVGHFDNARCETAIAIIKREAPSALSVREWAKSKPSPADQLRETLKQPEQVNGR